MRVIAIILARGGSKGVPRKNLIKINNIPLLSYTIRQCKDAGIKEIYTSSNDQEILEVAQEEGSNLVFRPNELSSDFSTSESGWIHAIDNIPNIDEKHDWIFAPQVTSPLREKFDIENGIEIALNNKFDSIFSAVKLDDFLIWKKENNNILPVNYDFKNRLRRQDQKEFHYLENGSFYLFKPYGLRKFNNRLYGRIGYAEMNKIKMFQIDSFDDIVLAENLIKQLNIN